MTQTVRRTFFVGVFVLLPVVTSGCSIRQTVKPIDFSGQPMEVCILRNEDVRQGFLDAYTVRSSPKTETASLNECTATSTYTTRWAWDLALYFLYEERCWNRYAKEAARLIRASHRR
jgi:hypothetical protein